MKGQILILQMFAWTVVDDDGTEGVPAFIGSNGVAVPLVGADRERIEQFRAMIMCDPTLKGKRITLAQFSVRTDLETVTP